MPLSINLMGVPFNIKGLSQFGLPFFVETGEGIQSTRIKLYNDHIGFIHSHVDTLKKFY